jgi:ribosomal protein L11 methyltransferase
MNTSSCRPVMLRSRRLDKAAASALATSLETLPWPPPDAVALLNVDPKRGDGWTVEAIFATPPDAGTLARSLEMAGLDGAALSPVTLPDIDWVGASLERLKPVRASRFLLHGSHDRGNRPAASIAIEIDAGTAFGTGHHGTTLGCLKALDDLLKRRRPRRILDVGSGSGVLAIAAFRASHALVCATDIDPEAIRVTQANARLNRARIRAHRATGSESAAIRALRPYDVILANILARPLAALAYKLRQLVGAGAVVVLSGLQLDQERWVLAAYRHRGFRLIRRIRIEGWSTLVLQPIAMGPINGSGGRPRPPGGSRPAAGRYRPAGDRPAQRARARRGTG